MALVNPVASTTSSTGDQLTTAHFSVMMDKLEAMTLAIQKCTEGVGANHQLLMKHSVELAQCRGEIEMLKAENANLKLHIETLSSQNPSKSALSIQEIRARLEREPNIIIAGIPDRSDVDTLTACNEVLAPILVKSRGNIVSAVRLGTGNDKQRLVRVQLSDPGLKYHVLKCKHCADIRKYPRSRILSDLTPMQSEALKDLRRELLERQQRGERHLTIKYVNGEPAIVVQTEGRGGVERAGASAVQPVQPDMCSSTATKRIRSDGDSPEQPQKARKQHPNDPPLEGGRPT